jgi:hypothetical protein
MKLMEINFERPSSSFKIQKQLHLREIPSNTTTSNSITKIKESLEDLLYDFPTLLTNKNLYSNDFFDIMDSIDQLVDVIDIFLIFMLDVSEVILTPIPTPNQNHSLSLLSTLEKLKIKYPYFISSSNYCESNKLTFTNTFLSRLGDVKIENILFLCSQIFHRIVTYISVISHNNNNNKNITGMKDIINCFGELNLYNDNKNIETTQKHYIEQSKFKDPLLEYWVVFTEKLLKIQLKVIDRKFHKKVLENIHLSILDHLNTILDHKQIPEWKDYYLSDIDEVTTLTTTTTTHKYNKRYWGYHKTDYNDGDDDKIITRFHFITSISPDFINFTTKNKINLRTKKGIVYIPLKWFIEEFIPLLQRDISNRAIFLSIRCFDNNPLPENILDTIDLNFFYRLTSFPSSSSPDKHISKLIAKYYFSSNNNHHSYFKLDRYCISYNEINYILNPNSNNNATSVDDAYNTKYKNRNNYNDTLKISDAILDIEDLYNKNFLPPCINNRNIQLKNQDRLTYTGWFSEMGYNEDAFMKSFNSHYYTPQQLNAILQQYRYTNKHNRTNIFGCAGFIQLTNKHDAIKCPYALELKKKPDSTFTPMEQQSCMRKCSKLNCNTMPFSNPIEFIQNKIRSLEYDVI